MNTVSKGRFPSRVNSVLLSKSTVTAWRILVALFAAWHATHLRAQTFVVPNENTATDANTFNNTASGDVTGVRDMLIFDASQFRRPWLFPRLGRHHWKRGGGRRLCQRQHRTELLYSTHS